MAERKKKIGVVLMESNDEGFSDPFIKRYKKVALVNAGDASFEFKESGGVNGAIYNKLNELTENADTIDKELTMCDKKKGKLYKNLYTSYSDDEENSSTVVWINLNKYDKKIAKKTGVHVMLYAIGPKELRPSIHKQQIMRTAKNIIRQLKECVASTEIDINILRICGVGAGSYAPGNIDKDELGMLFLGQILLHIAKDFKSEEYILRSLKEIEIMNDAEVFPKKLINKCSKQFGPEITENLDISVYQYA